MNAEARTCSDPSTLFKVSNVQWRSGPKQGVEVCGDIEIKAGRMTAVIGDSGSGKTTFLNLLAGFIAGEPADSTKAAKLEFYIPGPEKPRAIDLLKAPPAARHRRHLGFVFQASHLLKNATCTANLVLPNAIHGLRINPGRVGETLDALFEPEEENGKKSSFEHNRVRVFSGGESQRVALGRAVFHSPLTLLVDEPTGNLDEKRGQALMSFLRQWCDDDPRRSVVWVTHNLDDVCKYADDVIVLQRNKPSPSLPSWPAPNPKDIEILRSWKEGQQREAPPPSKVGPAVNGASQRLLTALGPEPERVPWFMRFLPSRLPLKLALAEVFGGQAADAGRTRDLNEELGYSRRRFGGLRFLRALLQAPLAFNRWLVLFALLLSLFIFFAVSQAKTVFGHVFDAMQRDPDVAYVLAAGSVLTPDFILSAQNIEKFRDSYARCLQASPAGSAALCETDVKSRASPAPSPAKTPGQKIFGRWYDRQGPELAIAENKDCEALDSEPPDLKKRLPVRVMAADRAEPAMNARFAKAQPAAAADGSSEAPVIVVAQAAQRELRERYGIEQPAGLAHRSLCLKLHGRWQAVRLGQGVTELPPDPDYEDLQVAVTSEFYLTSLREAREDLKLDLPEWRYTRVTIYFQPNEIPTVREWAHFNRQILHPEAFKKVERLMSLTSNAELMIDTFFWGTIVFIGIFMAVIFSNYILTNEKFFCVLRAFGAGHWFMAKLVVYQLLVLCGLACGLFLLMLWPLNHYLWPQLVADFSLPADTPDLLNAARGAFPIFLGVGAGSGFALTWAWIWRNAYIGERLKSVG